jgi:hypothetical protein
MAYERINWQNEPSEATALNDVNLNKMDSAIYELDGKATTTETAITNLQDGKVDKVNGKGLSQVDNVTVTQHVAYGTVVSTIKTYGQDGTEVTSQVCNGINVDSALSDSSTNPVQNKVVKGALDNKVDKESGKGLSYYDVISVARETSKGSQIGSINLIYKDGNYESNPLYNGIEVDSSLDGTSENPVENKAIYDALNNLLPSKTVSGNPISISDASGFNAKALKVTMNPIQDLHGYSNPWAGGAGKNKFHNTAETTTTQGITFNVNADGTITGENNATGTAVFYLATVSLPNGNYILNGCPSDGGSNTYKLDISKDGTFYADNGNGVSFTVTNQEPYLVRLVVYSGNGNGKVFKPMVRLATVTDDSFAPYENICPISGRTEASVTRTGKNLFDKNNFKFIANGYIDGSSGQWTGSTTIGEYPTDSLGNYWNSPLIDVTPLKGKTITYNGFTSASGVARGLIDKNFNVLTLLGSSAVASGTIDLSQYPTAKYLVLSFVKSNYSFDSAQLEIGSTATDYEPYTVETKTHQYSETIYGGVDDFLNGGATVSTGFIEFDGSNDESWTLRANGGFLITIPDAGQVWTTTLDKGKSNMLIADNVKSYDNSDNAFSIDGSNRCYVSIPSISSVADLRTFLATNNLQIAYPLSTPTTISTSAEEITLLKGNNVLSTNADDMELKYSVSLDSLLPTTTRTLAKSPIVEEPKEETDETEEQR